MATWALTGTGQQALSAGTVALHITITTVPPNTGKGYANPTDYYGVGFLRPGDGTGYWDPYPVLGGPQWMPLPWGTTSLAYALLNGAGLSVVEVSAPAPLAYPLALLPDVALTAPSSGQVLTYNGTQWANATPSAGGGAPPISEYIIVSGANFVDSIMRYPVPATATVLHATGTFTTDLATSTTCQLRQYNASNGNMTTFQLWSGSGSGSHAINFTMNSYNGYVTQGIVAAGLEIVNSASGPSLHSTTVLTLAYS